MTFKTADLSDEFGTRVQVVHPAFRSFGGLDRFWGRIDTVKCFEDNSRVREALLEDGEGKVLVVDAGGSLRCAILGDQLAALAVSHGWKGVLLFGCIRDAAELARMEFGVMALAAHPRRSVKRGEGVRGIPLQFGGVTLEPACYVYCDPDGIIVSPVNLLEEKSLRRSEEG